MRILCLSPLDILLYVPVAARMFNLPRALIVISIYVSSLDIAYGSFSSSRRFSSYKAAVVEFAPKSYLAGNPNASINKEIALQNMKPNLDSMDELAKSASAQGAEIIVFPESGVTGRIFCIDCKKAVRAFAEDIPDVVPGTTVNPCTDNKYADRPVLQRLSCIARNHSIVLVANMPDEKDELLFNTDVVFETDGSFIAKYYKQHLFAMESQIFNTSDSYRYITFQVSFGVEFSVFICYDVLFCDPPLDMVNKGIKNFVYSTYWGNRYPHYMSVSVRQGWSWRNKVNVLSSGINNKFEDSNLGKFYSSGSGIYSAGKPLGYYVSGETFTEPSGRLIIADVPLVPGRVKTTSNGQRLQLTDLVSRDTPLRYNTLDPEKNSLVVSYGSQIFKNLTCKIDYKFSYVANNETYALAASIYPDRENQAITYALCSLSKRPSNGEAPQSTGYSAVSKFQYLKLTGTFSQYPQISVMPMVLGDQLQLFDPSLFILKGYKLKLRNREQSILVANLWGKIAGTNDEHCSNKEYIDSFNEL